MKKNGLRQTLPLIFIAFYTGVMALVYWFVWIRFYAQTILVPFYQRGNWLVAALYVVFLYVLTSLYGGYRIGYWRIHEIVWSQILAVVITNFLTYLQISLIGRMFLNPYPVILMSLFQLLPIVTITFSGNFLYFKLNPPRKLLLIYQSMDDARIVTRMNSRREKYNVSKMISSALGEDYIKANIADFDGIVVGAVESDLRNRLVSYCYTVRKRVYMLPSACDVMVNGADTLSLFDTPILLCRNESLNLEQRFLKRLFDLVLSVALIAVASPVMLIAAAGIFFCDRGPVFFFQRRVTVGGKEFTIVKFRSMIREAEKDGAQKAVANDSRITPIGRLLRATRIDELPQLFNVLKGDMSMVGPRPERIENVAEYCHLLPDFDMRHLVKAGLTGYAQVFGKYNTTPQDKLNMDLF